MNGFIRFKYRVHMRTNCTTHILGELVKIVHTFKHLFANITDILQFVLFFNPSLS